MASNKNQTALYLANEISKSYSIHMKNTAESVGLKSAHRVVLFELAHDEGCTQLTLVHRTGLKAPTVSITLREMEKEGLVIRQTDEHDLRKTHVYMTERARELVAAVKTKMAAIEDVIFRGVDLGDKEIMVDAMQKVRNNLILLHRHNENFGEQIV